MNDLEAMNEMCNQNLDIRMSGSVLGFDSNKKTSSIKMQLDYKTAQELMRQYATNEIKYLIGLYIVNKEQFDKIKANSLKQ